MTEELSGASVDKEKKITRASAVPIDEKTERGSNIDEFFRGLQPDMRRPKPGPDAVAAAIEAAQRLAAEADAEDAAADTAHDLAGDASGVACSSCGHRNRGGNRFCAMCGAPVQSQNLTTAGASASGGPALVYPPNPAADYPEIHPPQGPNRTTVPETHHYHHHYHHHYFPGGYEGSAAPPRAADPAREDKLRSNAALRGDMSRAEAAVRRVTQEWVLACNTKHLDDLLDLYIADALVLRSNYPQVRGAAAVREFFFGILDAGFGEVEVEPLRLEVAGDMAYEAGRWKALVPSAAGKRREERGKYLWVFARQSNGEWKLASDCWSSDLTLTTLESDVPQGPGVRTRKNS
ncbi:MAG TPA: DUF4440 domain-containing protein [Verrucomicrobiae bacterium]|nr:DUF4440 domain-containing protein [Verrucomicrobiae bacterium]